MTKLKIYSWEFGILQKINWVKKQTVEATELKIQMLMLLINANETINNMTRHYDLYYKGGKNVPPKMQITVGAYHHEQHTSYKLIKRIKIASLSTSNVIENDTAAIFIKNYSLSILKDDSLDEQAISK